MTVRTYDKNGEISTCWRYVKEVKLMTLPRQNLTNLHMFFEDGTELDYYLSEHERFATIKEVVNRD